MKSAFALSGSASLCQEVLDAVFSMRYELVAFFSAALLYAILSPKRSQYQKALRTKKLKIKLSEAEGSDAPEDAHDVIAAPQAPQEPQAPQLRSSPAGAPQPRSSPTRHMGLPSRRPERRMQSPRRPRAEDVKENLAAMKAALHSENFDEAFNQFSRMWRFGGSSTEPTVTQDVVARLVELGCKKHRLATLLSSLEHMPVPTGSINAMLCEAIQLKDPVIALVVERIARAQPGPLEDSTYSLLIKSLTSKPSNVRSIIEEVFTRDGPECSPELVLAVLAFCKDTSDSIMADVLFERTKPKQPNVLSAFVQFYLGMEEYDTARHIFEHVMPSIGKDSA